MDAARMLYRASVCWSASVPAPEVGAFSSPQAESHAVSYAPDPVKVITVFPSTVVMVYRDSSISASVNPVPRSTPRL